MKWWGRVGVRAALHAWQDGGPGPICGGGRRKRSVYASPDLPSGNVVRRRSRSPPTLERNHSHPPSSELTALLGESEPGKREAAWEAFVEKYSGILMHAARNGSSNHDDVMDRYA